MEPLKLRAAFKDYLWGGTKLNERYHKHSGLSRTAESWELSVHPDGLSVIDGGALGGVTLAEYLAENPAALGSACPTAELPVLVKLIDAADDLSVQVHPNDEQARAWEGQNGKTEMWYVMEAEPNASIVYGFRGPVSEAALKQAVRDETVVQLLDRVPSHRGQVFFVKAGTVHAIGAGNLIAEIQQSSNVTYRLYDYGRRDKNGNLRELHLEKGVRAAVLDKPEPHRVLPCADGTRLLGRCSCFEVRELSVCGTVAAQCSADSYRYLLAVEGHVTAAGVSLNAGEGVFLPAGLGEYTVDGQGTVLIVSNPTVEENH